MCKLGARDHELADALGVDTRTVNRWKITHPDFAAALRRGKEAADNRVEDSLYHRAMGTEFERETPIKLKKIVYGSDGKKIQEEERVEIVMVKEVIPADTTAAIFWLKNRRKDQWRDVHKHEHGGAGAFDKMDDAALGDYLEAEAREILPLPAPEPALPMQRIRKRGRTTEH